MATRIDIRPARAEDVSFLVECMRVAATSHLPHCFWDVLFGLPPDRVDGALAAVAESEAPHWCHRDRFVVAERDGELAGALSIFDPSTEGDEALEAALLGRVAESGLSPEDVPAVLTRAESARRATPGPVAGAVAIENVAVRPEHRGTGVVDALLSHAVDTASERGAPIAEVLCLNGNHRAEAAWRRHGFEVVTDYRDTGFERTFGAPGLRLFTRELG